MALLSSLLVTHAIDLPSLGFGEHPSLVLVLNSSACSASWKS